MWTSISTIFGLDSATKIDSVEVRWPSGAIEHIGNLAADQFYSVLEGKGIVPREAILPHKAATALPSTH